MSVLLHYVFIGRSLLALRRLLKLSAASVRICTRGSKHNSELRVLCPTWLLCLGPPRSDGREDAGIRLWGNSLQRALLKIAMFRSILKKLQKSLRMISGRKNVVCKVCNCARCPRLPCSLLPPMFLCPGAHKWSCCIC